MEYLEGETLAQRLNKGALPLDQALQYAIQMADALDKAHRQGIVHRDLKPGNIMLTKAGTKLLDFGLAKLGATPAGALAGVSALPTQEGLTAHGTILGTFQYMAPEQLEGKDADARTDIFAFGAVVYEMVTGKKAFDGKSHASLIAAILEHEPPALSAAHVAVPRQLEHVVRRCLAKSPEERWQTASDLHRELKWAAESTGQDASRENAESRRAALWRRPMALGIATAVALLAAAATTGVVVWTLARTPRQR
jgi:serine/threonine protein kinase